MLKLKNKKIVVTGGNGTIGQVLVSKLKKLGVKVEILSSKNDIRKRDNLDFEEVDYVFHLAAKLEGERKAIYDVNVLGTKNVLDEAVKNGVKRVLYVSTVMVFEDTGGIERDEGYKKKNKDDGWYADSKIKSLNLAKKYRKKIDMIIVYPCVVLKKVNNKLVKPGRWMSLVGSGKRWCNYVGVEKVADLMIKALVGGKRGGRLYFG